MASSLRRPLSTLKLSPLSLLALLPWLALLAWLASVAWFLDDDAFISFRYTRNLIEGHGLVFNPGERVEGYTNFLWILELAAIWAAFDIRPELAAPWLSVAYTAATIAALLWWTARLPSLQSRSLVRWMALGLLCASATFAVWTSGGGLETRQFTFFIVAAIVCLSLYQHNRRGLFIASLALAAAELTRPEALLLAACAFAWFALQRLAKNRTIDARSVKDMAILVAPFALLVAAHFLFRYAYYGEWLPNTYYAKHVRPWYESGFRYLWIAALESGLYILLPLTFLAMRSRWRIHQDGSYALVLLCLTAHMAYLLPIGGDRFEFRPLDFYWPLLALPAAEGLALLGSLMATGLRIFPRIPRWAAKNELYTFSLFLLLLFYASAIQGLLLIEGARVRAHITKEYIELNRDNASWLLTAPGMPMLVAISNDLRRQAEINGVASRATSLRRGYNIVTLSWKPFESVDPGIIPDDALHASSGLGKSYYLPSLKVLDIRGLTDATVARTPSTRPNLERQMAHDRLPTSEFLKERGVNIYVFPPATNAIAALERADYAVKAGPDLWMPFEAVSAQWAADRFAHHDLRKRNTFSTIDPAANLFLVGEDTYVGQQFLARFTRGFDGWQFSGDAFSNFSQHPDYPGQALIWNRADSGFLTSYHPKKGNQATGKARSPTFTATADQYLAFLIAGGDTEGVGLRLLADGKEVARWRGRNHIHWLGPKESFRLIVHPLGYLAGKSLQLELFDYALGSRGHIMLDHLMLVTCHSDPCAMNDWMSLANTLAQQPRDDDSVYLIPAFAVSRNYLYLGANTLLVPPMTALDLVHQVESNLAGLENLSSVKVVQWNSVNPSIEYDVRPLTFLLAKYGRFLGSDDYDHFKVHNFADITFEHPWVFFEQLEPITVNFDGGIGLNALALGLGPRQLPSQKLLDLGPERSLWAVLQWRTEPGLEIDYAISLRLYNAGGERAYQQDDVLWNKGHWPTSHWHAGAPVDTTSLLHLPPDLPPGYYELKMVVYDFETQTPTVQIDTWQPEITLARLRLAEPP